MKRNLTLMASLFLLNLCCYAQIVKQGEPFIDVSVINDKVALLKEIPHKDNYSADANFAIMKDWAKEHYAKDPFISSVFLDSKKREFIAKSRIELLLPANKDNIREIIIMRYRVNGYVFDNRCVLEITDISFLCKDKNGTKKIIQKVVRAEDFITDKAMSMQDDLSDLRSKTRSSALYFFNELGISFEKEFANN